MIATTSCLIAADNAGAIVFKCITVFDGYRRRYARLGDLVGSVSKSRRKYSASLDKKMRSRKVKKKRKIKSKKRKEPTLRPYLTLLVSVRAPTRRADGSSVKFDSNRVLTFTEPTRFGPAGKTENIPNFLGSRVFGPVCQEILMRPLLRKQFKSVIVKAGDIAV
jgi:ribosomal protein L14